jgi:hypothetical protein
MKDYWKVYSSKIDKDSLKEVNIFEFVNNRYHNTKLIQHIEKEAIESLFLQNREAIRRYISFNDSLMEAHDNPRRVGPVVVQYLPDGTIRLLWRTE